MTAISYHDTIDDLQDLDWSGSGPFARPSWFALLEKTVEAPLYATARQGVQAVTLPLRQSGRHLEALTNWYAFTWSDLHTGGPSDAALLEDLARALATRTPRVTLTKLPEEDRTLDRLRTAFRDAGWAVFAQPCDTNHVLEVGGRSFSQYLADRPGPVRTTLQRKAKKVDVTLSTMFEPDVWSAYEAIYADSWKPKEGDPDLLRAFAQSESKAGRYRFALARHEGAPVAAQFWTVDGDTAYIHKLAHRKTADHLSPGTTLTAALFERVIDTDKVARVDFGTGDDPYKRDWMEQVRTRWRLDCLRPENPRNWPVFVRAIARKLVSRRQRG
ncbi:GNAT family N-acetyltransferase [Aurantiacibacter poecillastricola]|uniref:GNAT family N-acetyltransferase n=1 Tax=Aurantiacibacter poecillastricola TaxID=3064385 RepID=UPI00273E061A|nr:GNAT family N-acetyltransferase [Aurantiacibacter sp. 219JJ12-13]MDP5262168.1 GNAT family N-acetyltransferase [Aurantiacibacter sp. 219JJ12-13]